MEIAYTVLATVAAIYLLGAVLTLMFMWRTSTSKSFTPKDVLLCLLFWWLLLPILFTFWVIARMVAPNYKDL